MIPIYDFVQTLDVPIPSEVGHTRPWKIFATKGSEIKEFVVKLYTPEQVNRFCLCNEIICNVLAKEFELKRPEMGLINIPDDVNIAPEFQEILMRADHRLKFATEVVENNRQFSVGLNKSFVKKRITIEMLYAFDNLIKNADRGQHKSNLLMTSNDAYLIDHELALQNRDININDVNILEIEQKFTHDHIFYSYLKSTKKSEKLHLFDEFELYLRTLKINCLEPYYSQLNAEGFAINRTEVLNWLYLIQQNTVRFVNNLKISIQ